MALVAYRSQAFPSTLSSINLTRMRLSFCESRTVRATLKVCSLSSILTELPLAVEAAEPVPILSGRRHVAR
jgi:hypothetical protein